MSKFRANIFLIATTSNYFWSSVACKNQSFQSWLFHSSIIFGAKIEISGTKWVEKTPIYIFFTFGSKINEFEQKKFEKESNGYLGKVRSNFLGTEFYLFDSKENPKKVDDKEEARN